MSGAGLMPNVALRPWPASSKEALEPVDVFTQIAQLTNERGHLRFITEKTLQGEIDAGDAIAQEPIEASGVGDQQDSKEDKISEIRRKNADLLGLLQFTSFHAGNALDLVALLLSKDPTKSNDKSFSHIITQQHIPKGSFGLDKAAVAQPSNDAQMNQKALEDSKKRLVAKGSRLEALDSATDNLLKAATQLQTEVRKETAYWNEILSISEKNWSLQRLKPKSRNSPYAVRYGFPEASDHFKARSLAPLRMNKDGAIILDPALSLKPKTLRVRIVDGDRTVGTSSLATPENRTGLAIEESIQLARESLFEEELYHEMSLESRQLLSFGVELRNSVIQLVVPSMGKSSTDRRILIDCIPRDGGSPSAANHSQDELAQNIAEGLRLLLAHEHRIRLSRRSQIPPPLTQHKRPNPGPPLLRILLAMFHHISAVNSLQNHLSRTTKILHSAGLEASYQIIRETSLGNLPNTLEKQRRKDISAMDQVFESFTKPLDGLAKLSLPSSTGASSEEIVIATRTYIGHPTYGAEYKVTLPLSLMSALDISQDQKRDFRFSAAAEVESYLDWLLALDLAHIKLPKQLRDKDLIPGKGPQVSLIPKDGKKGTKKDLAVQMADGKLMIAVGPMLPYGPSPTQQEFIWDGTPGKPSFVEKVKRFLD